MITLDDKLGIFYKIVYKNEEEKCKKLLEEFEERSREILKEKEEILKEKKEKMINRKVQLAEKQKKEVISKIIQQNRQKVLSKKKEILDDLILSLEERFRKFVSSNEYEDHLLKSLERSLKEVKEKKIIVYIRETDKDKLEDSITALEKENGVSIVLRVIDRDIIGGFILSDEDNTYNLDNSFKTIIEEKQYYIGKILYKFLEEAGDIHE